MSWGPQTGPNNQNIVDAIYEPNSYSIWDLQNRIDVMSPNGSWPGYMAPGNVDSSTNFNICYGTYYQNSSYSVPNC